jgi:hypothetical protein
MQFQPNQPDAEIDTHFTCVVRLRPMWRRVLHSRDMLDVDLISLAISFLTLKYTPTNLILSDGAYSRAYRKAHLENRASDWHPGHAIRRIRQKIAAIDLLHFFSRVPTRLGALDVYGDQTAKVVVSH